MIIIIVIYRRRRRVADKEMVTARDDDHGYSAAPATLTSGGGSYMLVAAVAPGLLSQNGSAASVRSQKNSIVSGYGSVASGEYDRVEDNSAGYAKVEVALPAGNNGYVSADGLLALDEDEERDVLGSLPAAHVGRSTRRHSRSSSTDDEKRHRHHRRRSSSPKQPV